MRDYSKISPKFWIGQTGKKLRSAGMEAQIVSLYLMSCPNSNMLGLFYCPISFIAHETGLSLEGATKGLQRAIEAGFCMFDADSEVVWVVEMASYQIADSLTGKDLRIKGVQNEYDALPENHFLEPFYDKYSAAFCMVSKRIFGEDNGSPLKAPSKPRTRTGTGTGTTTPREETPHDVAADVPPAVVLPPPSTEGLFAVELRKLGVSITSSHPTLLAWVKDGFLLPNILEAVELARMAKPAPQTIPAGYLDAILRKPDPVGRPAIQPAPVTPLHDHRCRHEENGVRCEANGVRGKNGKWYCNDHKHVLEATA